jgi:hypothetical protein
VAYRLPIGPEPGISAVVLPSPQFTTRLMFSALLTSSETPRLAAGNSQSSSSMSAHLHAKDQGGHGQ